MKKYYDTQKAEGKNQDPRELKEGERKIAERKGERHAREGKEEHIDTIPGIRGSKENHQKLRTKNISRKRRTEENKIRKMPNNANF